MGVIPRIGGRPFSAKPTHPTRLDRNNLYEMPSDKLSVKTPKDKENPAFVYPRTELAKIYMNKMPEFRV
jgi:hypothetical protein